MTSSANSNVQSLRNLIDGNFLASSSEVFFSHESPRAGTTAIDVPKSDLMDVVQAVQAMNRGQAAWLKFSREERDLQIRNFLTVFAAELEGARTVLAQTLAVDIGMPLRRANSRSVSAAIQTVLETLKTFETSRLPVAHRYPAAGNTALMMGWTDPLLNFCRRVPVVLAAGNAICVKPSSRAPRTVAFVSALVLEAMKKAGMPLGLFAVLNGYGEPTVQNEPTVGEALLTHPGIKTIFWIGRSDAAEAARAVALAHGKRFHFVGSGRNPAILFDGFEKNLQDAQLIELADAVIDPHSFGPYRPSRFFVHESIYKEVIADFERRFLSYKVGDPLSDETDVGPLPKRETVSFENQLQMALSETGRLVTGGKLQSGIPQPTLVRDLTNCSTLQSEELAGPWATIASFKYSHEALKYANTSPLGLASYVMHPDLGKANAVAEKLEASRVFFSARPPWPRAFISDARAVKRSANNTDGLTEVFKFVQWSATHFRETSD
jgi:acyl-CoA reductase-like NAD-dependent aldehyde dehydrogenase